MLCLVCMFVLQPAFAEELSANQLLAEGGQALETRQYAEAERLYTAALQRLEAEGAKDARLAVAFNGIGLMREAAGDYREAESMHRRAASVLEALVPAQPLDLANVLANLGLDYCRQRLYAKAEKAYSRSLELKRGMLGADHPEVVPSLNALAIVYQQTGRFPEAEETLEHAQAILAKGPAAESVQAAVNLNNLATISRLRGRLSEALVRVEHGLAKFKRLPQAMDPTSAPLWINFALTYAGLKKYRESEALYAKATEFTEQCNCVAPSDTVQLYQNHAALLRRMGKTADAKRLESRAKVILDALERDDPSRFQVDYRELRQKQ